MNRSRKVFDSFHKSVHFIVLQSINLTSMQHYQHAGLGPSHMTKTIAIDRPSVTLISQLSTTRWAIEIKTQTLISCSSPWLCSRRMNDIIWRLKFLEDTISQLEDLLVASLSQCSFLLRLCSLTLCLLPHHQYLGIFIALQGFLHSSEWSLASWHSIKSYTVEMMTTC